MWAQDSTTTNRTISQLTQNKALRSQDANMAGQEKADAKNADTKGVRSTTRFWRGSTTPQRF